MKAVATLLSLCRVWKEEFWDQIHVCPITDGAPVGTRVVQANAIHQASTGTQYFPHYHRYLEWLENNSGFYWSPDISAQNTASQNINHVLIIHVLQTLMAELLLLCQKVICFNKVNFFIMSLSRLLPKFPDFLLCIISIHFKHFIPNLREPGISFYFAGLY